MRIDLIQGCPAWLQWRKGGIGGSDIAAIMGLSPFKDSIDVYNEKKGISVPFVNDSMRRGTLMEPEARYAFECAMRMSFPPVCWQHDEYDFCRVSLDGYNEGCILEIKVTSPANYLKVVESDTPPAHYAIQVQWQLFVRGCKIAWLIFFNPATHKYHSFVIASDYVMQELAFNAAKEFWEENMLTDIPPDNDHADEYLELVDEGLKPLCDQYIMFSEMKRISEEGMKTIKPRILDFSDSGNFRAYGLKATWTKSRATYNMAAMKADGIDVDKYKKSSEPSGYFALTKEKE